MLVSVCVMERAKHSFLPCPILLSCLVMNKICLNQLERLNSLITSALIFVILDMSVWKHVVKYAALFNCFSGLLHTLRTIIEQEFTAEQVN